MIEQNNEQADVEALEHDEQGVQIVDTPGGAADTVRTPDDGDHGHDDNGSEETFSRAYVEKLRKENAKYRERAGKTDELAHRLHTALVAADGRLADPADLEFNEEHLDDPEALAAAVAELIERKPGLRAQKLRGDVGAGDRGTRKSPPADLISLIRGL